MKSKVSKELKEIILQTIENVKNGTYDMKKANTISANVRTYLKIVNSELAICELAKIKVPSKLIDFVDTDPPDF